MQKKTPNIFQPTGDNFIIGGPVGDCGLTRPYLIVRETMREPWPLTSRFW